MKSLYLVALALAGIFSLNAAAKDPDIATGSMRRVYLMPMANGLDQYLAAHLTREHALLVVTDPKAADVILTDRIGDAFEQMLEELYPTPKPAPKPDARTDTKTDAKPENSNSAGAGGSQGRHEFRSTAARGTIFMVDARSRQVVWSDHEKPVNPTDASLDREAARIVRKLQPTPSKPR